MSVSTHQYYLVDTTVGGLLDHDGVIHPVVSVSILTWFIRYLHFYQYYLVDTTVGGLLDHDFLVLRHISLLVASLLVARNWSWSNSPPTVVSTK
jgi:hypothetical protein